MEIGESIAVPGGSPSDPKAKSKKCTTHSISLTIKDPHFVPKVEKTTIEYRITGPIAEVTSLRCCIKSVPSRRVVRRIILAKPFAQQGKIAWSGTISSGGTITLADSPYEVYMVLTATGCPRVESKHARTEVKVKSVTIRVGALSGKLSRPLQELADELDADPETGRLRFETPVFKTSSLEMTNAASSIEYRKAVGTGQNVPLLAEIELLTSTGSGKRCPAALKGSRVLWDLKFDSDAEYGAELKSANRAMNGAARAFVTKVSEYKQTLTKPEGRNCHADLGGQRGSAVAGPFGALPGGWSFARPGKRPWAGFTELSDVHEDLADTGVRFLSTGIAGDSYRLRAVLDARCTLDQAPPDAPDSEPAEFQSNPLRFTNWRRIDVVTNYKFGTTTTELDIAALNKEYSKAAVEIREAPGLSVQEARSKWKTYYKAEVATRAASDEFVRSAVLDDPDKYPVRYREFDDYKKEHCKTLDIVDSLWFRMQAFFGAAKQDEYKRQCEDKAYDIYIAVASKFRIADQGLTFFKFETFGAHNQIPPGGTTVGIAPAIPAVTDRNKAVFLVFQPGQATETLVHEVGHLVFLAHAPGHFNPPDQPAGFQANAHDKHQICLMSYHPSKLFLCGLCYLKLAGWSYLRISKAGDVS